MSATGLTVPRDVLRGMTELAIERARLGDGLNVSAPDERAMLDVAEVAPRVALNAWRLPDCGCLVGWAFPVAGEQLQAPGPHRDDLGGVSRGVYAAGLNFNNLLVRFLEDAGVDLLPFEDGVSIEVTD